MINKSINALVGSKQVKDSYSDLALRAKNLSSDSERYRLLCSEIDSSKESINELVKNKIFSFQDGNDIKEGLDDLKNSNF